MIHPFCLNQHFNDDAFIDECVYIIVYLALSSLQYSYFSGAIYRMGFTVIHTEHMHVSLSGVPDFFDRNKILSGGDLSHYQVPLCIRVLFYFVWFVFIHHNFQFYFKLCTYCNILDINLS